MIKDNVLIFYINYLQQLHPDYKYEEVNKEELLASSSHITNHHICINDLTNWQTIAIADNKFYKYPIEGFTNEWCIIYTDICDKIIILSNDNGYFVLSIYDSSLFSHIFTLEDLKLFLEWINIDKLTNKVNQICDYIITTSSLINNYQVSSKRHSLSKHFYNNAYINIYIEMFTKHMLINTYDELFIYKNNGLYHESFINCFNDQYSFSKEAKGFSRNILIYFPIDDRSILVIKNEFNANELLLMFLKCDKVYFVKYIESISQLQAIFDMLNRNDISEFLQKIDMIHTNNWQKYIKNQPIRKIKYYIKHFWE